MCRGLDGHGHGRQRTHDARLKLDFAQSCTPSRNSMAFQPSFSYRHMKTGSWCLSRRLERSAAWYAFSTLYEIRAQLRSGQTEVSIPQSTTLSEPYYAEDGSLVVVPSPSIEQKPLFGSAPSVHASTLYALYASHIATLVWSSERSESRRNVIVGLALRDLGSDKNSTTLSEEERVTFKGVSKMILDSYVSKSQ